MHCLSRSSRSLQAMRSSNTYAGVASAAACLQSRLSQSMTALAACQVNQGSCLQPSSSPGRTSQSQVTRQGRDPPPCCNRSRRRQAAGCCHRSRHTQLLRQHPVSSLPLTPVQHISVLCRQIGQAQSAWISAQPRQRWTCPCWK